MRPQGAPTWPSWQTRAPAAAWAQTARYWRSTRRPNLTGSCGSTPARTTRGRQRPPGRTIIRPRRGGRRPLRWPAAATVPRTQSAPGFRRAAAPWTIRHRAPRRTGYRPSRLPAPAIRPHSPPTTRCRPILRSRGGPADTPPPPLPPQCPACPPSAPRSTARAKSSTSCTGTGRCPCTPWDPPAAPLRHPRPRRATCTTLMRSTARRPWPPTRHRAAAAYCTRPARAAYGRTTCARTC